MKTPSRSRNRCLSVVPRAFVQERMAECLKRRVANDIDASASGAIFNSCG